MKYYISDLHLGDERIIKLCSRPFKNVKEQNEYILKCWNKKIKATDEVYILGDIGIKDHLYLYKKLKGRKYLIVGNHDIDQLVERDYKKYFITINHQLLIKDGKNLVFLNHYPVMDWPNIDSGAYHIYGHIHNKILPEIKKYFSKRKALNASSDVVGFVPRTLKELIKLKENNHEAYIN